MESGEVTKLNTTNKNDKGESYSTLTGQSREESAMVHPRHDYGGPSREVGLFINVPIK